MSLLVIRLSVFPAHRILFVWEQWARRDPAPLAAHLDSEGVEFMQFAFRWMNCLLMREISVNNTIRMWDTYLVRVLSHPGVTSFATADNVGAIHHFQSEGTDAFSQFHLYVCSAFLVQWSDQLRKMDFQVSSSSFTPL